MMAIISALKTNRVDTVTLWEPGTTMALRRTIGYSVVDLVIRRARKVSAVAESLVEVIAAKEELLSQERDH